MVDIVEGNKLIAEFMGIRFNNGNAYDSNGNTYMRFRSWNNDMARNEFFRLNKLYHNSWDWLMPVMDKIESLKFWTKIGGHTSFGKHYKQCCIKKQVPNSDSGYIYEYEGEWNLSKLDAVYNAVVVFIQWYNENK